MKLSMEITIHAIVEQIVLSDAITEMWIDYISFFASLFSLEYEFIWKRLLIFGCCLEQMLQLSTVALLQVVYLFCLNWWLERNKKNSSC